LLESRARDVASGPEEDEIARMAQAAPRVLIRAEWDAAVPGAKPSRVKAGKEASR
jgi:hypothetical protein